METRGGVQSCVEKRKEMDGDRGWKRAQERENDGVEKREKVWERKRDARNIEEGREIEEDGKGMVRRPCAIKVGIEVVVRNDNTSTYVSIILPRGIPYAIGYSKTVALCNAFF